MQSRLIRLAHRFRHRALASLALCAISAASARASAEGATPALHLDVARAAITLLPARPALAVAAETTPAPAVATPPSGDDDGASLRIAGYVAGGVGIAGLALFAIAGLGAKSAYDRLDAACGGAPCADDAHQSDVDAGTMLQTAANIGLATGLTGLGLGATLLVLGNRSTLDKRDTAPAPHGAMITYGGQF